MSDIVRQLEDLLNTLPYRRDQHAVIVNACTEIQRLQAELETLRDTIKMPTPCTCGSGMHPRRCEKHPQGFDLHAMTLDYENAKAELATQREATKMALANVEAVCQGHMAELAALQASEKRLMETLEVIISGSHPQDCEVHFDTHTCSCPIAMAQAALEGK